MCAGGGDSLGSVGHTQFSVNVPGVGFDGGNFDVEQISNFLIGSAFCQAAEHLELFCCERFDQPIVAG